MSVQHPAELKPIPALLMLNNKGGVGKTTDSSLAAEYFSLIRGRRVLLIDFDGQMNLTAYWVGMDLDKDRNLIPPVHPDYDPDDPYDKEYLSPRSNIADIFYGRSVLPHATFIGPDDPDDMESPRVDIIAGNRAGMKDILANLNKTTLHDPLSGLSSEGTTDAKIIKRLGEFCSDPSLSEQYDVVIIDSGPTETPLFTAAIQASTHIIAPYKPEEFSVMGVNTLINSILSASMQRTGRTEPINFLGLLPCLVDLGRGLHEQTIETVSSQFASAHFPKGLMITNTTAISSRQSKTAKKPDSIFMLPPSHPVRKRCDEVFEHIYQRIFGNDRTN